MLGLSGCLSKCAATFSVTVDLPTPPLLFAIVRTMSFRLPDSLIVIIGLQYGLISYPQILVGLLKNLDQLASIFFLDRYAVRPFGKLAADAVNRLLSFFDGRIETYKLDLLGPQ